MSSPPVPTNIAHASGAWQCEGDVSLTGAVAMGSRLLPNMEPLPIMLIRLMLNFGLRSPHSDQLGRIGARTLLDHGGID